MKKRTKRILLNITEGIVAFVITILGFLFLITATLNIVYYKRTRITNYSMRPTLNMGVTSRNQEGDYVFVNSFSNYEVGDIVIANVSWWETPIIKRLVGCPGDKVQIRDEDGVYKLYCNDTLLYTKGKTYPSSTQGESNSGSIYHYEVVYKNFVNNTAYMSNPTYGKDYSANIGTLNSEKCIQLNEGEYFLMGDNWGGTDDCLKFGPVKYNNLDGKVDYVIPLGENTFEYLLRFVGEILFTKENTLKY